jgi:hypothetical protein
LVRASLSLDRPALSRRSNGGTSMERFIADLVKDFDSSKKDRREFC